MAFSQTSPFLIKPTSDQTILVNGEYELRFQQDLNLVIYHQCQEDNTCEVVWALNMYTNPSPPPPPDQLPAWPPGERDPANPKHQFLSLTSVSLEMGCRVVQTGTNRIDTVCFQRWELFEEHPEKQHIHVCKNAQSVLFLSDEGKLYLIPEYTPPSSNSHSLHAHLESLITMHPDTIQINYRHEPLQLLIPATLVPTVTESITVDSSIDMSEAVEVNIPIHISGCHPHVYDGISCTS